MLLAAALACSSRSPTPAPAPESSSQTMGASDVIMLYRSPCYARCPVYSVRVTKDGLITYEGRDRVAELGTRIGNVPPFRVQHLLSELEAAGYFRFANRYRPSERVCGRYVPDAPTVITEVRWGDRAKRIEHDQGCGAAPEALGVLETRIDEVLGSARWTGR